MDRAEYTFDKADEAFLALDELFMGDYVRGHCGFIRGLDIDAVEREIPFVIHKFESHIQSIRDVIDLVRRIRADPRGQHLAAVVSAILGNPSPNKESETWLAKRCLELEAPDSMVSSLASYLNWLSYERVEKAVASEIADEIATAPSDDFPVCIWGYKKHCHNIDMNSDDDICESNIKYIKTNNIYYKEREFNMSSLILHSTVAIKLSIDYDWDVDSFSLRDINKKSDYVKNRYDSEKYKKDKDIKKIIYNTIWKKYKDILSYKGKILIKIMLEKEEIIRDKIIDDNEEIIFDPIVHDGYVYQFIKIKRSLITCTRKIKRSDKIATINISPHLYCCFIDDKMCCIIQKTVDSADYDSCSINYTFIMVGNSVIP